MNALRFIEFALITVRQTVSLSQLTNIGDDIAWAIRRSRPNTIWEPSIRNFLVDFQFMQRYRLDSYTETRYLR